MYQERLTEAGFGEITTEIAPAPTFYYAEDYHQQYLAKNPRGYCPDHSTGVSLPDRTSGSPRPTRRSRTSGDLRPSAMRPARKRTVSCFVAPLTPPNRRA